MQIGYDLTGFMQEKSLATFGLVLQSNIHSDIVQN